LVAPTELPVILDILAVCLLTPKCCCYVQQAREWQCHGSSKRYNNCNVLLPFGQAHGRLFDSSTSIFVGWRLRIVVGILRLLETHLVAGFVVNVTPVNDVAAFVVSLVDVDVAVPACIACTILTTRAMTLSADSSKMMTIAINRL